MHASAPLVAAAEPGKHGKHTLGSELPGIGLALPGAHAMQDASLNEGHALSAPFNREHHPMGHGPFSPGGSHSHVPTAVGGTADGTDRSTGDTQNMGESAETGGTLA